MKNNNSKGKVKMTIKKVINGLLINILGTILITVPISAFFGLQGMTTGMFLMLAQGVGVVVFSFNIFADGILGGLIFMKDYLGIWIQFQKPILIMKFRSPIVIKKQK